jgi:hypothetical protein
MALTDNIVAYYKFDSDNSNDSVSSNNGTDTAMIYNSSAGKINDGASFNGSTSIISLPSGVYTLFSAKSSFSINCWIQLQNYTNQYSIFSTNTSVGNFSSTGGYFFVDPTTGTLDFYRGDGSGTDEITSSSAVGTNVWTMVSITSDGSNLNLYVNGNSAATAITMTKTSPTQQVGVVGSEYFNGTNNDFWPRYIDELGFWSRALSPSEITQLYNSGSGLQYPFSSTSSLASKRALLGVGI